MRVLLVTATLTEAMPLLHQLNVTPSKSHIYRFNTLKHSVTLLITGVGIIHTTYNLTLHLATETYDMAIDFGICGSFNPKYLPGHVVNVISDRFADLGVEDGGTFLDVFEAGIEKPAYPFDNNGMLHSTLLLPSVSGLMKAAGVTVNTVHGIEPTIQEIVNKYTPDVESMEGAAFYYVCALNNLPATQVRSISNMVERRNRANWKIKEAIEHICQFINLSILE